jgi:hypothetical protein
MADVLPSSLGNFGLELCFLTHKLSQKNRGDMLTTKIDKNAILLARSVSQTASLRRARRVDQFSYLIYPNRTADKKVIGFESF